MTDHYRGIPIPKRLERNFRLKNGMPLPYVASFDDESEKVVFVDGVPHMTCSCEIGTGIAQPGKQCPRRNRICISGRRCGACGRAIALRSTMFFVGAHRAVHFSEPGVHKDCLIFSLQACTGITRNAEKLSVVEARSYSVTWLRWLDQRDTGEWNTRHSLPDERVITATGVEALVGLFSTKPDVIARVPVTEFSG